MTALSPTKLNSSLALSVSLNQLEREEEAYEAKMRGIADVQTALPIGVRLLPLWLGCEKKVKELQKRGAPAQCRQQIPNPTLRRWSGIAAVNTRQDGLTGYRPNPRYLHHEFGESATTRQQ
jgi:hypothetical protein